MTEGEPATVNDDALAATARALLPEAGFEPAPPLRSCGSDDFGFYRSLAPTLMVFVGLDGAPNTQRFPPAPPALSTPARGRRGRRPRSGPGPRRLVPVERPSPGRAMVAAWTRWDPR